VPSAQRALGDDHYDIAEILHNIGLLFETERDFDTAM